MTSGSLTIIYTRDIALKEDRYLSALTAKCHMKEAFSLFGSGQAILCPIPLHRLKFCLFRKAAWFHGKSEIR